MYVPRVGGKMCLMQRRQRGEEAGDVRCTDTQRKGTQPWVRSHAGRRKLREGSAVVYKGAGLGADGGNTNCGSGGCGRQRDG